VPSGGQGVKMLFQPGRIPVKPFPDELVLV
jgi:hypothetical protein